MSLASLPRAWRRSYAALLLVLFIASYVLLYGFDETDQVALKADPDDQWKTRETTGHPTDPTALQSSTLLHQGSKGSEPYADNEMLWKAYKRSPCSGLEDHFVGSDPLFPPCDPSIPPGVATWGKYPYLGPFKYTKKSKNPCFTEEGGQFRCLPYFFLVGFSKCGTTDMYARLSKHPQVAETLKEFAWFSRRRFPEYPYEHVQNFSDYLDGFNGLAQIVQQELQQVGHSKKVVGDYSVMAVNEVFEWPQLSGNEGCSEPRVINANHIRHLNPDIKVIVLMRHPVQRLYSRFLFDYKRSTLRDYRTETEINMTLRTPEKFHEYVVDGLQKYEDCFRRFSLRHCIYNRTLWETVHGLKIQDSMYTVLLEDWLRVVPRDQFIFLRSEDFKQNLKGVMESVFKHLDLDPLNPEEMEAVVTGTFRTVNKIPAPPMLAETEAVLRSFFRPFVHRLAQVLNDPRFLWQDV